jgi:hypothetical protein
VPPISGSGAVIDRGRRAPWGYPWKATEIYSVTVVDHVLGPGNAREGYLVAVSDDDREHITSGPRWDRLLASLDESIRVLKKRGNGQGGWIQAMQDSYQAIADELAAGGHVRPSHYRGWVRGEMLDPRTTNP